jgi:hypothetical protein
MAPPSARRRGPNSRTGSTSGADLDKAASVVGLKELRRELKKLENPREWSKELAKVQRTVAQDVAAKAQIKASGMGGVQKHFAKAIRGRGTVLGARIAVGGRKSRNGGAEANAAFWGAKKRTGFYARYRFKDSTAQQHPTWIGNSWDVAVKGQGPYAINDAIAEELPETIDKYADAVLALTRRAFPD